MKLVVKVNNIQQASIQASAYLLDINSVLFPELYALLKDKTLYILVDSLLHESDDFNIPKCSGIFIQDFKLYEKYRDVYDLYFYAPTLGTNSLEIQTLLKSFKGVFLSKDLGLDNIKLISKSINTGLCYYGTGKQQLFYSYRKLLSIYDNLQGEYYLKERKRDNLMTISEQGHETKIYSSDIYTNLNYLDVFKKFDLMLIDLEDFDLLKDVVSCYNKKISYDDLLKKYKDVSFNSDYLLKEAGKTK